jgi:hypothetical protein
VVDRRHRVVPVLISDWPGGWFPAGVVKQTAAVSQRMEPVPTQRSDAKSRGAAMQPLSSGFASQGESDHGSASVRKLLRHCRDAQAQEFGPAQVGWRCGKLCTQVGIGLRNTAASANITSYDVATSLAAAAALILTGPGPGFLTSRNAPCVKRR